MKRYNIELNAEYAGSFALYFIFYAVISSFCSAFLLNRGYSSSEIGIILAAASVVSVFIQPFLASLSDRSDRLDSPGVARIGTAILMIFAVGLMVFRQKSAALWLTYMMIMAWHLALQPIFNSFGRKLSEGGSSISFGICRAGGSLGYAIFVAVMGTAVEKHGTEILPGTGMVSLILLMGLLFLVKRTFRLSLEGRGLNEEVSGRVEAPAANEADGIDMKQFLGRNKMFLLLNLFILLLYFQNNILNNFMYQIVVGVGGDSEDMGRIFGVMAFLEIPAFLFFDRIHRHFRSAFLLKVASLAFVFKVTVIWLSNSVIMIYAAHFFHIFSFSLFLATIVQFINEIMAEGEAVRGQAVYTTAITVSGIFGNILGGIMLDASGPKLMLMVSVILTVIGASGVLFIVDKIEKKAQNP